jgi:branched-chain amino acid transport system substrate-binding protein
MGDLIFHARMASVICVLSMGLSGCSMSRFAFTGCETNGDCRDAFGWGNVCSEFLCEPVKPSPRCTETWPPRLYDDREEFRDAIVLGVQFDRSAFELETFAAELAFRQVMEGEGLEGQSYALIECTTEEDSRFDNLSGDDANLLVAQYLADEIGVPAIIGPATSTQVDAAYLAVKDYGTLIISPTATSPALTDLDGLESTDEAPGLLWRTAPPDDLQGIVMAQFMNGLDIKTVDVIFEEGPYGTALTLVFDEEFRRLGGTVSQLGYESGGVSSRDAQIAAAASSGRDAVVFISGTKSDTVAFLNEVATQDGLDGDRQIFLADGGKDIAIFEDAAALSLDDLGRILGTAPAAAQGSVYDTFAQAFSNKYRADAGDSAYTAFAYDAAWLTLYGTAWSYFQEGRISGIGIARGLRQISAGDQIDIVSTTWTNVVARFKEGININVSGASGELDYDENTGETMTPIDVWRVIAGEHGLEFETIESVDPDSLE